MNGTFIRALHAAPKYQHQLRGRHAAPGYLWDNVTDDGLYFRSRTATRRQWQRTYIILLRPFVRRYAPITPYKILLRRVFQRTHHGSRPVSLTFVAYKKKNSHFDFPPPEPIEKCDASSVLRKLAVSYPFRRFGYLSIIIIHYYDLKKKEIYVRIIALSKTRFRNKYFLVKLFIFVDISVCLTHVTTFLVCIIF